MSLLHYCFKIYMKQSLAFCIVNKVVQSVICSQNVKFAGCLLVRTQLCLAEKKDRMSITRICYKKKIGSNVMRIKIIHLSIQFLCPLFFFKYQFL